MDTLFSVIPNTIIDNVNYIYKIEFWSQIGLDLDQVLTAILNLFTDFSSRILLGARFHNFVDCVRKPWFLFFFIGYSTTLPSLALLVWYPMGISGGACRRPNECGGPCDNTKYTHSAARPRWIIPFEWTRSNRPWTVGTLGPISNAAVNAGH